MISEKVQMKTYDFIVEMRRSEKELCILSDVGLPLIHCFDNICDSLYIIAIAVTSGATKISKAVTV